MKYNIHEREIIRWAKAPFGTGVWKYYKVPNGEWILLHQGMFLEHDGIYVVDDELADIRKLSEEGNQIQVRYIRGDGYTKFFDKTSRKITWTLKREQYRLKDN